jgi:hypothetical protein
MKSANGLKQNSQWVGRVTPCAPLILLFAAGSRRRAIAALWRAAKAEGLPGLPVHILP